MPNCCAPNCGNSQARNSVDCSFHEFPVDPEVRSKWLANIGRPNWIPGRRSMICSAHFKETDLARIDQHIQLLEGAVPSIFQSLKRKRDPQCQKNSRAKLPKTLQVSDCTSHHVSRAVNSTPSMSFNENQYSNLDMKTGQMFVLDGTISLGDKEFVEKTSEARSPQTSSAYLNIEDSVSIACNVPLGNDTISENIGSVSDGNILILESDEGIMVSDSSQLNSRSIFVIEESLDQSEEICEEVPHLSDIATPFFNSSGTDSILVETSFADNGTGGDLSLNLKRSKMSSHQTSCQDAKDSDEADETPDDDLLLTSSQSSIVKGVVGLPASLADHMFANNTKERAFIDIKWQDGAYMCRLCGVASNRTLNLFSSEACDYKLLERISSVLHIKIVQSDDLPQNVCSHCVSKLDTCSELIVTSFNTHRHIASVVGPDCNHSLQLPVYFDSAEKETHHNMETKRHILLMEIHHVDGRPIEEYLAIAYEDLHARLNPEEKNRRILCNLLFAPILENCCVSQVEQGRTAAEALISNEIIQAEVKKQLNISNPFDYNDDQCEVEFSSTIPSCSETLPQKEPEELSFQDEHNPETDNTSGLESGNSRELHCYKDKFPKQRLKRNEDFKKMQKLFLWQMLDNGDVQLICRLCNSPIERNTDLAIHFEENCGALSSSEKTALLGCSSASDSVQVGDNQNSHQQISDMSFVTTFEQRNPLSKLKLNGWYQCSFCCTRLQSKAALKQHLTQQHFASLKCGACGHEGSNVFEATLHRQSCCNVMKTSEWHCVKCLEIFSSETELKDHQSASGHSESVFWLCDACGKRYTSATKLNEHKKSHLPPESKYAHQCPLCPKQYINSSRLKEHMQRHEKKKFMCKVCGKLFGTKQILRQHEFTHADPQFLCSLCSRTFFRKSHLLKHMNVHDPANTKVNRSGPQPHRDGLNRCRSCKEVFEKNLLEHYKTCHPSISLDQYTCEICKVENTSHAELFQHQREVHKTGVKDCPFCNKTIDGSTQMKYHLMRHEGMYPYNCPLCTNGYTANSLLQDHIRRKHTGEKPFECQQCSKRFPTSGALAQHSTVHSLPHQLLPCPICSQGFKRKAHLDVHLRTHTGEKPYHCPLCDRPFRQRQDCVKHVRIIHGEDPSKFSFHSHSNTFSQVISVADMELVLEGEDLMQTSLEIKSVL